MHPVVITLPSSRLLSLFPWRSHDSLHPRQHSLKAIHLIPARWVHASSWYPATAHLRMRVGRQGSSIAVSLCVLFSMSSHLLFLPALSKASALDSPTHQNSTHISFAPTVPWHGTPSYQIPTSIMLVSVESPHWVIPRLHHRNFITAFSVALHTGLSVLFCHDAATLSSSVLLCWWLLLPL